MEQKIDLTNVDILSFSHGTHTQLTDVIGTTLVTHIQLPSRFLDEATI